MDPSNTFDHLRNGEMLSLKSLFYLHVILVSCALGNGITFAYIFYNCVYLFLLGSGVIMKDKHEHLEMAVVVNIISGIFDLFTIPFIFTYSGVSAKGRAMVGLINMLLRIYSHFAIKKEVINRREGGPYQNIDDSGPAV